MQNSHLWGFTFLWMFSMCLFSVSFQPKVLSHSLHTKVFNFLCTLFMCFINREFSEKNLLHSVQEYFLMFLCTTFMWDFRFAAKENNFKQWSHLNFKLLWTAFLCAFKWLGDCRSLRHRSQTCGVLGLLCTLLMWVFK